ncbi:hypothetical protein BDW22DRAFT_1344773 [Trametopsis cervina]|nr:hypothetical protein BDW22DRAFT_1344773 [Trametopsis cervina]
MWVIGRREKVLSSFQKYIYARPPTLLEEMYFARRPTAQDRRHVQHNGSPRHKVAQSSFDETMDVGLGKADTSSCISEFCPYFQPTRCPYSANLSMEVKHPRVSWMWVDYRLRARGDQSVGLSDRLFDRAGQPENVHRVLGHYRWERSAEAKTTPTCTHNAIGGERNDRQEPGARLYTSHGPGRCCGVP